MNLVKYMNQNKLRFFFLLFVFFLSETAMVTPLVSTTNSVSPLQIQNLNNQITPLTASQLANTPTASVNLKSSLDQALFDWVNASKPLSPSLYKMDVNNNPIITVFAPPGSDLQSLNHYMNVNSFIDLGEYGLIVLGSVTSTTNLLSMVSFNPLIKVSSDPLDSYLNSLFVNSSISQPISNSPNQFVSQNTMGITQANAMNCGNLTVTQSCNGTGVTIAMVDGGVDFGNSDLSNASALDANGLPMSFDTEGWSLVATPLTVGKDIPISKDNTTLLFNNVPTSTLDKLQINDPGNVAVNGQPILDLSRGWEYWHNVEGFMSPQNWKINASWINQPGQAPPKFGIGVEQWQDLYTGKIYPGYFYALLIDLDHDGQYDSVVIDMATSAWATYLKYISDGGSVTPMSQIQPDFNFANDKVVSWFTNNQRQQMGLSPASGSSYTFAVDWNGDGVNDWSYGSMASAYNHWNFLPINQTQNGKIIHGVDPQGSGFVALYPFGYGFSEHGTFTSSVAVSRGLVPYNVFSNNTGSWDYPYGNSSTRTLPGAASGANLMSVSWGSSPQDELLAWFWAAGFNLNTTISANTADITGAQWIWSGHVRANITSNSWGIGGLYWGGFWGTDWISDLLSMPNMGGNSTYVRKIADIWSAGVMDGPSTGQNLGDINYSSSFIPFTNANTNNTLYIGSNNPYVGVGLNVSIPASSDPGMVAEFYNGVQWQALTVNNSLNVVTKGINWLYFTLPQDWKLSNITSNGQDLYWIRFVVLVTSKLEISNILFEYKNPYEGYPGMLMVVAAGNDNYYQSTASPFGALTLKVGASSSSDAFANLYGSDWGTTSDQMAYFSSAGPKANGVPGVDIVAPGYYVYSGTPLYHSVIDNNHGQGDITSYGGNGQNAYIIWAGTSASTPAIAGVAAIAYQAYIAKHPGVIVNPNLIKQIIKSTASNLEYPSNIQGAGFVNASAIVDYILNPSTSPYFVTGSNITYEDQLASSSWLSNIGQFYWYYAYSAGDSFADVHDFPVSNDSLLSYSHYDTDLSTSTVTQGTTINTQVAIQNSVGNFAVSAVHPTLTNTINKTYVVSNKDNFLGPYNDYLVNISLANLPIWSSDYIEITITNIPDFNTVGLYVWHDYNGDGKIETANQTNVQTNGAGELGKVQIEGTTNEQGYGVLQIGNPGQYNNSFFTPILILRGNPQLNDVNKSNWASGDIIGVSIKTYNLYNSWSNAITTSPWKTVNGISYWNVSIDTTNIPAGYNLGFLKFTNTTSGFTEFMPLSVKVGYGQIDQTDPSTNPKATPTVIGTYNLEHLGSTYQVGFQGGSMIWVPFAVNESKTTTSDVLAIRVTQVSGNNATIGFVLHYDATPNYFDASWFQIFDSEYNTGTLNGQNVNWQYIPWDSVGFEQGAFVSRFGYLRYQSTTSGGIVNYRIGLFTTNATSPVSVKLEMYWLSSMPSITSDITTKSALASYCQDSYSTTCLSYTNILFGPNADLELVSKCTQCDPNLPSPSVVFGVQQAVTNLTTGNFPYGVDPSYSVDYWEKRTFQAGDLVEFSLLPTDPSATFEVFIFNPTTIAQYNQTYLNQLPMSNIAVLLSSDYQFGNGGSFIAPTTGQYWFGIDDLILNGVGTANTNWILYTKASRGPLYDLQTNLTQINTMSDTQDGFGLPTEATYNVQTGVYDNVTNFVLGANSPTGLSNGLYSVNIAVDNYVAPFVTLGNESLALNNTVIDRGQQNNITFDWNITDLNNNVAYSHVIFEGPFSNDVIQDAVTSTSYTMSLSNLKDNGWWTIAIIGDDSLDPANTINGVDYGGPGFPAFFRVFIQNSTSVVTTQTEPQGLLTPFGYGVVGVIFGVGVSALGALIYLRRVEVKSKYSEIKNKVSNEINKRRGPKT